MIDGTLRRTAIDHGPLRGDSGYLDLESRRTTAAVARVVAFHSAIRDHVADVVVIVGVCRAKPPTVSGPTNLARLIDIELSS